MSLRNSLVYISELQAIQGYIERLCLNRRKNKQASKQVGFIILQTKDWLEATVLAFSGQKDVGSLLGNSASQGRVQAEMAMVTLHYHLMVWGFIPLQLVAPCVTPNAPSTLWLLTDIEWVCPFPPLTLILSHPHPSSTFCPQVIVAVLSYRLTWVVLPGPWTDLSSPCSLPPC